MTKFIPRDVEAWRAFKPVQGNALITNLNNSISTAAALTYSKQMSKQIVYIP